MTDQLAMFAHKAASDAPDVIAKTAAAESSEHYTPAWLLAAVRSVAPIDLDPASATHNNARARMALVGKFGVNGLQGPWIAFPPDWPDPPEAGRRLLTARELAAMVPARLVWCNPPYKRIKDDQAKGWATGSQGEFVAKAWEQFAAGNCETVVLLVQSKVGAQWAHQHLQGKATVGSVRGRICFEDIDGVPAKEGGSFDSMVVIYSRNRGVHDALVSSIGSACEDAGHPVWWLQTKVWPRSFSAPCWRKVRSGKGA